MPTIEELAATSKNTMASSIAKGLETLDLNQTVTFTKYIKVVLPLDGFVFWVKADLLSASSSFNGAAFNKVGLNTASKLVTPAATLIAKGSLHYSAEQRQEDDQNYSKNRVVFTSEVRIDEFEQVSDDIIYIGVFNGLRFAFSQIGSFYQQANLFHYSGDAIYPAMESQIIDDPQTLDTHNVVTSNSLAIWLGLDAANPLYPYQKTQSIPLYPAKLVPQNLPPTYGVVIIDNASVESLQAAPVFDKNKSHSQLVKERVKIILYGLRNFNAVDFVDYICQNSLDSGNFGIMNMPVIKDERREQVELSVIAMKKSVEFEINYNQSRLNTIAQQLVKSCIPTYTILP